MASPTAPVALFVFNRPDLTAELLEAVRAAKPPMLFVTADGPRPGNADDPELCETVRDIVRDVDWECEVHWNLHERNQGLAHTLSQGINWVFDHVDRAIILEDDCIPDPSFFPFCAEMLERYKDDSRVLQISGSNLQAPRAIFAGASYAFASHPFIWGWATWRRAWNLYDADMTTWPQFRDNGMLDGLHVVGGRRAQLRRRWDLVYAGERGVDWDPQWQYTVFSQHGLSIYPSTNLISNVGFRSDATQTTQIGSMAEVPLETLTFPLVHAPLVAHNPRLERFFDREILRGMGMAVTVLRRVLPSHRARRLLRRILFPSARHGPVIARLGGQRRP